MRQHSATLKHEQARTCLQALSSSTAGSTAWSSSDVPKMKRAPSPELGTSNTPQT